MLPILKSVFKYINIFGCYYPIRQASNQSVYCYMTASRLDYSHNNKKNIIHTVNSLKNSISKVKFVQIILIV